ncbi:NUDIX hydrolase [Aspergillus novofumigatus IBT 16806]|uniref:Nudix/MutT family protein n=3 Tax=Aspergillus subgen. Fumigati TaxID=2720872 RepID=A0A2I1CNA6_ASPN1|nr:Nudix/MutT family protein [Aspergillus novofumigatus IBT 16806]PKX99113.1 Nudix/MutT family protein [Aspergillus novofumigatus IBT 16806]
MSKMAEQSRSMESRVGRKNQRYGSKGERLVAGVVPLSHDKTRVLMIQSVGSGGWVLPKGGWETDEALAQQAACREAWEEAGVICTVHKDLGLIPDMRPSSVLTSSAPKASYQFFEVTVDREEDQWPEMHKRKRQWVTYAQAAAALASRPELLEALNRSSLKR